MKRRATLLLAALPAAWPVTARAADAAVMSPAVGAVQVVFGLIAVVGVMMTLAWLFRRYAPGVGQSSGVARIIGGVSVGSRERVLVIQVADRWLVVGVTTGQISRIAELAASPAAVATAADEAPTFVDRLAQALGRTRAER